MRFAEYDFSNLNESDIREEIIAPLLRFLGYRSGSENNIIREQGLNYPLSFLGRKKNTDPIIRGRADYICDVQNQVKWVIEAKAPNSELDKEAEEQAWTYANHPEIRAVYFCLCNGLEFKLFQTNRGPEADPLFQCKYENLEASLCTIQNILSPAAILRDHPQTVVDTGIPIGPGLRSIVRITSGSIVINNNTLQLRPLIGLTMTIIDGSVERSENGCLGAFIVTSVPFQSLQKLNEKLGLNILRLFSDDSMISTDISKQTVFSAVTNHVLPQGEKILDLMSWQEVPLPLTLHVETETTAAGVLDGKRFIGDFTALITYKEIDFKFSSQGSFSIYLG